MLKVIFWSILLLSFGASARVELVVKNDKGASFDPRFFEEAQARFESEIGPVSGVLTVAINPRGCLRTGYDRKTREVVFCPTSSVINSGLESSDVIHHELFHAFLCLSQSSLCERDNFDHVHEALADSFAYKLQPDRFFGEDFYLGQDYIREYATDWKPELVQGEHERGNALASLMIEEGRPLRDYLSLFEIEIQDPVNEIVEGVSFSKMNRYRLRPGQSMVLKLSIPALFGVERIVWELPSGVTVEERGPWEFHIQVDKDLKTPKAFAKFYSKAGKEIGRRTYYFGLAF